MITAAGVDSASSVTIGSWASEPRMNIALIGRPVSASSPARSAAKVSERSMRSALTSSGVTIATTAASGSMMHTAMSSCSVISEMPLASMPAASISETAKTFP
ncbi:hypothetical protein BN2156_04900 [Mycolicibacterium neworleansense]|uniref:Uncharacterized protein n=1 Tax=Mycolicibacterium neworleansense TaxID=146018 RepID=A0A0H5RVN6_9MYCO|nr:hypothetical protein BN2156_04900 [Mycolicibacterium neworleansense]